MEPIDPYSPNPPGYYPGIEHHAPPRTFQKLIIMLFQAIALQIKLV